jgi:NCS1 family nucleobase:cation symporter-1
MVANFVPPAYDLSNLIPSKINFRVGGLITAILGFVIGAFWVSVISNIGMFPFVNTLGAILAPVYGIMIIDYYIIKKKELISTICSLLKKVASIITMEAGITKHSITG